ncbi:MAG: copper-binding protein [Blastocatellia bacterium]
MMTQKISLLLMFCLSFAGIACQTGQPVSQKETTRRYDVRGKVVSLDKTTRQLKLDHEEIRDRQGAKFMDAMVMSFSVRDTAALEQLRAGDVIQAVLVTDENTNLSWLESVSRS